MKKKYKRQLKESLIGLIIVAIFVVIGYFYPDIKNEILGGEASAKTAEASVENKAEQTNRTTSGSEVSFDLNSIPEYKESPFVYINNNVPSFTKQDYTTEAFEKYSELDSLGRCNVAYANICKEIMPKEGEKRGSISNIYPTGWKNVKYEEIVENDYLYNRSHLIGWQLAGENANKLNLITGTRYMNVQGMLPFENIVDDYFEEYENKNNHVLYRVTPIYKGENLVASGVQMEAYSVEDKGEGVSFNVYVYNVQPGIEINYKTGESKIAK